MEIGALGAKKKGWGEWEGGMLVGSEEEEGEGEI